MKMTSLAKSSLFLLLALAAGCWAKNYRFDYEWNVQAGGWLKYHAVPATWDEARLRCHAEGAILASPESNQLKAALVEFVRRQSSNEPHIFTGVHAIFSKGDYASIEGTPLLRLAITWEIGEPDNYDNSESCLIMSVRENGTMADFGCNRVLPYVCYKKNTALTITNCGTIDTGYHLESRTGSCYKFHSNGLLWSQAYMTCMAEGGYLAIANNAAELKVIKEIFAQPHHISASIPNQFMVGIHDWGQTGRSFMTIHGQDLESVHHVWAPNKPTIPWQTLYAPDTKQEFSVNMYKISGNLTGIGTNLTLAFLCEKDPKSLL